MSPIVFLASHAHVSVRLCQMTECENELIRNNESKLIDFRIEIS